MRGWIKLGFGLVGAIVTAIGGKAWADRHIYNDEGYNALGFDRNGYDCNGYDKEGFNAHGFNRYGYDRSGYDAEGYDAEGYNASGYNILGFNRYGYDRTGRDADGYDRSGYDLHGYNRSGVDRSGNSAAYYEQRISDMIDNQHSSYRQLQDNNFRYALSDIRVGIEHGIKDILAHRLGKGYENKKLDYNIGICERNKLMEQDFIEKIYSAKSHCNLLLHENCARTFEQVYFCYKVLCEVTDEERMVVGLNPLN